MKRKFPRILFFISTSVPTEEDYDEAQEFGMNVVFRNVTFITADGCLEECDGVAGEVPDSYKVKPTAEEALTAFAQSFRRRVTLPEENEEVSLEAARNALAAETGKGKGKAASQSPATEQISTLENVNKLPVPAPNAQWTPNA